MKILHLSSEYPPAKVYGLGRFVHGLARAQAAAGDEVFVLTNSTGGAEDGVDLEGVRVHRITFPNPPRPADGHGEVLQFNHGLIARFLDRRSVFDGVEVVASHDWLTALAAREVAQDLKVPLVVTFHDEAIGKHFGLLNAEGKLVRDLEALTALDATRLIANSPFIAKQIADHYGIADSRITAIPGGIDPAVLEVAAKNRIADFRSTLAEPNELLVAYVGRLDPEKGLDVLAEAALIAGEARSELHFAIAGTGREDCFLQSRLTPLGARARLLGYLKGETLPLLYRSADVVVVPSLYEPFGLVALEAMLAGAVALVSDAGGLTSIVKNEENGLVVPAGDAHALARALVKLAGDPDLRARLREAGERTAREHFSWKRIAEKTRTVYEDAIAVPKPIAVTQPPAAPAPLVSITILAYNAPAHIETALRSILNRTDYPSFEVIIVDNGSCEEAARRLRHVVYELAGKGKRLELIRNEENRLFSAGQNQAIRAAQGEYVCLLNDDTEIPAGSEGWLRGLVWTLENLNAGTVTPVMVNRDGRVYCAGGNGQGHYLQDVVDEPGLLTTPRRTDWNNMACLLTRRSYFEDVGFLREDGELARHKSDLEWCARLADKKGLAHWVHPARVCHYSAEASRKPELTVSEQTRLPASVVLVAYNNLDYTREAIESVLAHTTPPFELVLVDNGSSDGTREYFHALRDQSECGLAVQVIENDENLGFPKAANQGARAARGRHVVLLNNDTLVRPGWLAALLDAAKSGDRVGIVTAKILNLDGTVQNAGGILHHPDGSFTIPYANEDRLAPPVSSRREVESAGGPCMLLTRELLDRVGSLDEGFSPGYFEDSDLCLRAREAGLRLLYEPRAEVCHYGKATASVVAREGRLKIWEQFEKNKAVFYARWRERLARDEEPRRAPAPPARRRILLCCHRNENATAAYCEAALRQDHDVVTAGGGQEIDLGDSATAEDVIREAGGTFDLVLAIEGDNYVPSGLGRAGCPTAWWATGNQVHAGLLRQAKDFDHVFVAQKDYVSAFQQHAKEVSWLPLACDPQVHRRHDVARDLDLAFAGNVLSIHSRRRTCLERLKKRFRVEEAAGARQDHMARLFSRAKIVFHCSLAGDLNRRVFEALACGSLLVTDRIGNGLQDLFADGEHLALYDDESLEDVVARYLADAGAREAIAARGQGLVTRHHTYRQRMSELVRHACAATRTPASELSEAKP